MHEGHRKRILNRICTDAHGLQDHELLEILLFNVIPRHNTNPLAHSLLSAFGSLKGVLEAPYESLLGVHGVGESTAAYLVCVGEVISRTQRNANKNSDYNNLRNILNFVYDMYRDFKTEVISILCINGAGTIKFCKSFDVEETDRSYLSVDEVKNILITQKPKAIVVVHNHPDASCNPSIADDRFTVNMQKLCSLGGVRLHDHIILGKDGHYSYFHAGKMQEVEYEFAFVGSGGEVWL